MTIHGLKRYLSFVVLLSASSAAAQEFPSQARGTGSNTAYQIGEIDAVNLFNGNLSLSIPIGPRFPVGGSLSYGLTLTYNSNAWDFEDDTCFGTTGGQGTTVRFQFAEPDSANNAGLGWNLTLGHFRTIDGTGPGAPPRVATWTYVSPDGARHTFRGELHPGFPASPEPGVFYTQDGSYLRGKDGAAATCPPPPSGSSGPCRTIEFPDGTEHVFFNVGTAAEPSWRVTEMRDRFGNGVEIAYGDHTWALTDSHGRVQTIEFDAGQPVRSWKKVSKVVLTDFDPDGTRPDGEYRFLYEHVPVERYRYSDMLPSVNCVDPPPVITDPFLDLDLLREVKFPDKSRYVMTNDHAQVAPPPAQPVQGQRKWGVLRDLQLPTGGHTSWDYDLLYEFAYEVPAGLEPEYFGANLSYGVVTKEVFGADDQNPVARWTYEPDQGPFGPGPSDLPCYHTNKVTDPAGNWRLRYFHVLDFPLGHFNGAPFTLCTPGSGEPGSPLEGPFLSQEIFEADGTTNGFKRRSVWLDFAEEEAAANSSFGSEIRYRLKRTVFHDDNDYVVDATRSEHDGLGHYRREVLTSTFPEGRNTRETFTNYNPESGVYGGEDPSFQLPAVTAAWVLETFDQIQVTEGVVGDGHRATTDYCFDPATGFLEGSRRRHPLAGGGSDILVRFAHDGLGNLSDERFWGGDAETTALPAGCSADPADPPQYHLEHTYSGGVLATSSFKAGGQIFLRTVDNTVDIPSGLLHKSRDPSGLETVFDYDEVGRPTEARPQEGAWTQRVYRFPTQAQPGQELEYEVRRCRQGAAGCQAAGNQLTAQRFRFDRLARLVEEWKQLPAEVGGDEVSRTFEYDALGRQTKVTEWGRPDASTEYLGFDSFGRPARVVRPDGSSTILTYTGDRIVRRASKVQGISSVLDSEAEEVRDAKGRLVRLREQSGTAAAFVDTTYEYDEGNRLIRVCSNASGGGCGQVRTFDYDDRGFLRSESHPELESPYNYTYDARGNVLQRSLGSLAGSSRFSQTFRYDPAGRVVQVLDAGGRMLKELFYSRTNGLGTPVDRRKGRLVQAKRHNYVLAGFGATEPTDVVVTEHYEYRGLGGRASRYLLRGSHGVGFDTVVGASGYDDLGNLLELGYPACLYHLCSDASRMNLAKSYMYGHLSGIGGLVTGVSYHPSAQVAKIAHANGVTDFRDQPATGWPRLSRIRTLSNAGQADQTVLRDGGVFGYDGSGNVTEIGGERFSYDRVGRLVQAKVDGGSGFLTRDYSYDVYGNLKTLTGANDPVGSIDPDAATNRLPAAHAAYDEAGNIEHLTIGFDYIYDPFNRITSLDGGAVKRSYLYNVDDERVAALDLLSSTGEQVWTPRGFSNEVLSRFVLDAGSLNWTKDYVHAGSLQVATIEPQGAADVIHHLHTDHLGSTRLITNGSGSAIASFDYFPFGGNVVNPGLGAEELQFTGHERDDNDSGLRGDLDYMHARYQSAHFARFLSPDRILGDPGSGQSWNRYRYAGNSPLVFFDPDGNDEDESTAKDSGCVRHVDAGPLDCDFGATVDVTPVSGFTVLNIGYALFGFGPRLPRGHGPGCSAGDANCQILREVGDTLPLAEALEGAAVVAVDGFVGGPLKALGVLRSSGRAFRTAVHSEKVVLGGLHNVVRAADQGYSYLSVVDYDPLVQRAFEAGLVARSFVGRSAPFVLEGGAITAQEVRTLKFFRVSFELGLEVP